MKGSYPSRKRSQSITSLDIIFLYEQFVSVVISIPHIHSLAHSLVSASLEQVARKFDGLDKYADTRTSFIITVMGPVVAEKTGGNICGWK